MAEEDDGIPKVISIIQNFSIDIDYNFYRKHIN